MMKPHTKKINVRKKLRDRLGFLENIPKEAAVSKTFDITYELTREDVIRELLKQLPETEDNKPIREQYEKEIQHAK